MAPDPSTLQATKLLNSRFLCTSRAICLAMQRGEGVEGGKGEGEGGVLTDIYTMYNIYTVYVYSTYSAYSVLLSRVAYIDSALLEGANFQAAITFQR